LHYTERNRIMAGDSFVLECKASGTNNGAWRGIAATGRRAEWKIAFVTILGNGKIRVWNAFFDRVGVWRQLGLLPQDRAFPRRPSPSPQPGTEVGNPQHVDSNPGRPPFMTTWNCLPTHSSCENVVEMFDRPPNATQATCDLSLESGSPALSYFQYDA